MRTLIGFLFILTLLYSATITGSIYSYDYFEKVNDSVMKFEGSSSHQIISRNGDYSIELEKGVYNVTVLYFENGSLKYYGREKIVAGEENQTFDIVVFSPSFFESDEFPDLEIEIPPKAQAAQDQAYLLAGVMLIATLAFFVLLKRYLGSKRFTAPKTKLGEEEIKVLRIIRENEGRMEQKQLRDILNFSESKMSLLLTELEVSGHIKRFKKGRENIIKLKKET